MIGPDRHSLPDAEARRIAAERIDLHIILSAGAGSGKTSALVDRYMHILAADQQADVDNIAAITFTNRAAREMKERLRRRFAEQFEKARAAGDPAAARLWRRRIRRLETAPISTIHALCTSILAQFPLAAGVDPQFTVIDELQADIELPRIVQESLLAGLEEGRDTAAQVVGYYESLGAAADAIRTLVDKRERYRQWLRDPPTGPGLEAQWRTEEHHWLQTRVKEIIESPQWRRLMTELDQAAEIAEAILARGEKDALADKIAKLADLLADPIPTTPEAMGLFLDAFKDATKGQLGGRADNWGGKANKQWAQGVVKSIIATLDRFKALFTNVELFPSRATAELAAAIWREAALAAQAWDRYKSLVAGLDFHDLQARLLDLLQSNDYVRARIQARFRHILVDEFQDTNGLQRDIIWALAGMDEPGRRPARVFVVGDAKQSIYRFRNADVTVFTRATRDFEQRDECMSLALTASFRPNQALMTFFNEVFTRETMLTPLIEADFHARYEPMEAVRDHVPMEPAVMGLLVASAETNRFRRRAAEARAIARFIRALLEAAPEIYDHRDRVYRPLRPSDIAILFRSMSDVYLYEDQLTDAGLPFYNVAGRGFFARQEVRDLTNALAVAADPGNQVALVGVLRSPMFAISDNTLLWLSRHSGRWWQRLAAAAEPDARQREPFCHIAAEEYPRLLRAAELLKRWQDLADRVPVAALLSEIIESTGYTGAMAAQLGGVRAVANINKLLELARQHDAAGAGGVEAFVRVLEALAIEDVPEAQAPTEEAEGQSIRLSTVHSAKGLQWPVVIVADLCRRDPRGRELRKAVMHPDWGLVPAEVDEYPPRRYRLLGRIIAEADGAEADAEDRRVLYVAMTRASDLLVLSSSVEIDDQVVKIPGSGWLGRLREACGLPKQVPCPANTQPVAAAALGTWFILPGPAATLPLPTAKPASAGQRAPAAVPTDQAPDADQRPSQAETTDMPAGQPHGPAADNSAKPPDCTVALSTIAPDPASRRRFAVTELADYLDCPMFYKLRHVDALPDIDPEPPVASRGLTPIERGTLIHRLLQMVGKGGLHQLEQLLGKVIPGGGSLRVLLAEDVAAVREPVEWFLATDFYKRAIASADRLRTEAWLTVLLDNALVEGKVDAVAEADGRLVLIDYKTGIAAGPLEDEKSGGLDEFQIALYAWGLEQLGRRPTECVIAYLGRQELHSVKLPAAAQEAFERARAAIAAIRTGHFPPRPSPERCRLCRLRWACAAAAEDTR